MTFKDIYKTIHDAVPECSEYQDEQGNAHLTMHTVTDTGNALIYPFATIYANELTNTADLTTTVAEKVYTAFLCFIVHEYVLWGMEELPNWKERGMDEVLFSFAASETLDKINDVLNVLIEDCGVDFEELEKNTL